MTKHFKLQSIFICLLLFNTSVFIELRAQESKLIKIQTSAKLVTFSDIFTIEKYIRLETSTKSLVSSIESMKFRNDTVYTFNGEKVYLWSTSGKFLGSIGKKGKGPEEMIHPTDFALSPSGQKIGIWDNRLRCLFIYRLNGGFIEKVNPKLKEIVNFCWTSNNQLIFNSQYVSQNGSYFSFYLTDLKGKQITSSIPFNPINEGISIFHYNSFPVYKNRQYVLTDFDQTVYELSNNKFTPVYQIEFDKGNLGKDRLKDFKGDTQKLMNYLETNEYCEIFSFIQTDDFFVVSYNKGKACYSNFISKKTQKQYRIQHRPENLDILGHMRPTVLHNGQLIGIVEPYLLKPKLKQMLPLALTNMGANGMMLKRISTESKAEDNPVLIFLKFNEK